LLLNQDRGQWDALQSTSPTT